MLVTATPSTSHHSRHRIRCKKHHSITHDVTNGYQKPAMRNFQFVKILTSGKVQFLENSNFWENTLWKCPIFLNANFWKIPISEVHTTEDLILRSLSLKRNTIYSTAQQIYHAKKKEAIISLGFAAWFEALGHHVDHIITFGPYHYRRHQGASLHFCMSTAAGFYRCGGWRLFKNLGQSCNITLALPVQIRIGTII